MTTALGAGTTDGDIPVWDDASSSWLSAQIESSMTLSDVTTGNASITKHGFLSKLTGSPIDVQHGDGSWGPAYGWRQFFASLEFLVGANVAPPWGYPTAIGTGTSGYTATLANHPGIFTALSSSAVNGGWLFRTAISAFLLAGGESSDFIFMCPTTTDIVESFGWNTTATAAAPAQAVVINVQGTTLRGEVCASGAPVATSSTYTISANTWYRGNISINAGYTAATFTLYTCSNQAQVWQGTCTAGVNSAVLPSAVTAHGVWAYQTSAGATTILLLDYISVASALLTR